MSSGLYAGGGGGGFEGVRTNPPFWLSSGFQNMQAHNKSAFLLKPVYAINCSLQWVTKCVEWRPVCRGDSTMGVSSEVDYTYAL